MQTFIDDEGLRKGEEITPALLKAIQNLGLSSLFSLKAMHPRCIVWMNLL